MIKPFMFVDEATGQVCCALPLGGNKKNDKDKKDKDKKERKKDKSGITKERKHKDKDKKKKKKKKKKGEQNVGLEIAVTDGEEERRLKSAIQSADNTRSQLQLQATREGKTANALRTELGKLHQQQQQQQVVGITLEDSDEDEENTTRASSTTPSPPSSRTTPSPPSSSPPSTTTNAQRAKTRRALIVRMQDLNDELLFLLGEAAIYQRYKVAGADELHTAVDREMMMLGQQLNLVEQNKQLDDTQLATVQAIAARTETTRDALLKRFRSAGFGSFSQSHREWEQDNRVQKIVEKAKPEHRHIIARIETLKEEQYVLVKRINEHEGAGQMQVEGAAGGDAKRDRERRAELFGQLKDLVGIANNDKIDVLGLYNKTHALIEAIVRQAGDLQRQYEGRDIPPALLQLLQQLSAKMQLIEKAWQTRTTYVASVVEPRKQQKDKIMADVLVHLPLAEQLHVELSDAAMLVEVRAHTVVPSRVVSNPCKLFALFDPERASRIELVTMDHRRNPLHHGPIDIEYLHDMLFTINDGLYLAPSQFANPHSTNGVYAAQDVSKNQIITYCDGRAVKDSQVPGGMVNMVQLFYGTPSLGVPHQYLLLDRTARGKPISSDIAEVIELDDDTQFGAGGLLHDCLNLTRFAHYVANRPVLQVAKKQGGGRGGNAHIDLDVEEERSDDDEESVSNAEVDEAAEKLRPLVSDPEAGGVRPAINCRFVVYHDEYNQLIVDAAAKTPELLVLLDPAHSIVCVEALRTIRRGEELLVQFDERVWLNYLRGAHEPHALGTSEVTLHTLDSDLDLRSAMQRLQRSLDSARRAQEGRQYPLINRLPLYDDASYVEPYEAPDADEDDDEDDDYDESDSQSMVPEDDEVWYGTDGDDSSASGGDDASDSAETPAKWTEEGLLRGVASDLDELASHLQVPFDARAEEVDIIRALIDDVTLRGDKLTDAEYTAKFTEILVRTRLLTDDKEKRYWMIENVLHNKSYNQLIGHLDQLSASYMLYMEFAQRRKDIARLEIADAVNNAKKPNPLLAQLRRRRSEAREALATEEENVVVVEKSTKGKK